MHLGELSATLIHRLFNGLLRRKLQSDALKQTIGLLTLFYELSVHSLRSALFTQMATPESNNLGRNIFSVIWLCFLDT